MGLMDCADLYTSILIHVDLRRGDASPKEKMKLLKIYLRVDRLCTGEHRSHTTWSYRLFSFETFLD